MNCPSLLMPIVALNITKILLRNVLLNVKGFDLTPKIHRSQINRVLREHKGIVKHKKVPPHRTQRFQLPVMVPGTKIHAQKSFIHT